MGSKSSSANSSVNNTRNIDQSMVDSSNGDGSRTNTSVGGDINGTVNITSTDHGAIKAAESVAEKSLSFASDANKTTADAAAAALQVVKENTSESIKGYANLAEQVKTDGAAQTKKLVAGVALALILAATIVAVAMNWKGKKA